jgi:hypothetical protein
VVDGKAGALDEHVGLPGKGPHSEPGFMVGAVFGDQLFARVHPWSLTPGWTRAPVRRV